MPVLRNAVEAVKPLVEERKHELLLSFTSTDLRLEADPTRLEQMLVNLLTNAAKYTPAGGRIQLIAGMEGGEFVCRVRDNGVGISPGAAAADVRPLRPGGPVARPLGGGPGHRPDAGAVARRAARRHHRRHERRPRQGERIRPPAARRVRDGPGPARFDGRHPGVPRPARDSRVLVVDDNEDTADGMARLLKLSGHAVRVAHNGPDAIDVAREHDPRSCSSTSACPGMDGYEVAARLRREECCKEAVIIAVSGYGEEQARRRSDEAGFDHHLVKPVNFDELFAVMERS